MKIRAITFGQVIPFFSSNDIIDELLEEKLDAFQALAKDLVDGFSDELNLEVETHRLCSQPLFSYEEQVVHDKNLNDTMSRLHDQLILISHLLKQHEFDYLAVCMMLADELKEFGIVERLLLNEVPEFINKHDTFFTSLPVASTKNGINLAALKSAAKIIKENAIRDPFSNLKFCISSNVKPDTPFFPAAYHRSENPSFSIALEMADEVIRVFRNHDTLTQRIHALKQRFKALYDDITDIIESKIKYYDINFSGIDFSPAPYPELNRSIGHAVEKLGFEYFGAHGSLLAAAIIKQCVPQEEKIIGFSGFMQPVLEDYTIAKRLTEDRFNLDTLLLYSTMCGTGLDCIPLPGDITERELFYIMLDVCTISTILNKPLTARLMPIPGKQAGEDIEFDFEYFAPSKVLPIRRLTDSKDDIFSSNEKSFHF